MIKLFDYQEKCVTDCVEYIYSNNSKPQIVVAPTAAGKSVLISVLADRIKKSILVLQPSKELLEQNYNKLIDIGGKADVYSASMQRKGIGFITYATLASIKDLGQVFNDYGVEILLIDECHYSIPPDKDSMFIKFINKLKPKKVIGFTATPFRLTQTLMNGAQLNMLTRMRPSYFKEYLHVIQIQDIIKLNRWSKINYETYFFDEEGLDLNTSGSDYTDESVKIAIREQGINNSIYLRTIKLVMEEGFNSILIFIDCLENADIMADYLNRAGIKTAVVSGKTPKKERDYIVNAFKELEITVVINYNVLSTGFDHPRLQVGIMGRPTRSLASYYQIVGRGTRIHEDKPYFLFIDYCNNLTRFGKVEDFIIENVDGWGWAVTNNDYILTNVPMANSKISKADILNKKVNDSGQRISGVKMPIGKHKGKFLENLPIGYMKWSLENLNFSQLPNGFNIQKEFKRIIENK